MEEPKLHFILFYTLNAIVEANDGTVEFNGRIKRAYIDDNDILMVELSDGTKMLADDVDDTELDNTIKEWRVLHYQEFNKILGI
jgi:hypothetical protein